MTFNANDLCRFRCPHPIRAVRFHSILAQFPFVLVLGASLLLSGCGNFWQNPYGTANTNPSAGTTASSVTLTPSAPSVALGANITLTAAVTPAAATGSVSFADNGAPLGSGTLNSGTATWTGPLSTAGTASLTANYSGDGTYASSTSIPTTVTVTSSGSKRNGAGSAASHTGVLAASLPTQTVVSNAPAIEASRAFSASDRSYKTANGEAAVVEANGSVNLDDVTLTGSLGSGRGVLLYSASTKPGDNAFAMSGGSLTYTCDANTKPACEQVQSANTQALPPALFSAANTAAAITLNDVTITNDTPSKSASGSTLLTAAAVDSWGIAGANGAQVTLHALGTALKGDVIANKLSTAAFVLAEDSSGQGSTLTGAVNSANSARSIQLTLDRQSLWIVTANSNVTNIDGIDLDGKTAKNIDGGGHCVYYSGKINGREGSSAIYLLAGGGYLAPTGTRDLRCD